LHCNSPESCCCVTRHITLQQLCNLTRHIILEQKANNNFKLLCNLLCHKDKVPLPPNHTSHVGEQAIDQEASMSFLLLLFD
jgi:hypothetical protein